MQNGGSQSMILTPENAISVYCLTLVIYLKENCRYIFIHFQSCPYFNLSAIIIIHKPDELIDRAFELNEWASKNDTNYLNYRN